MDYAVMLNIKGRQCVVFGGGAVATRKARELIKCGARLRVVSPTLSEELHGIYENGGLEWVCGNYTEKYLEDAWLCFACTDDAMTNADIAKAAEARHILANIADDSASSFSLPAVRRAGDVTLAVSAGANPAASRYIADHLLESLESWQLEYIQRTREIREICRHCVSDSKRRQDFMKSLFSEEYLALAGYSTDAAVMKAMRALNKISKKEDRVDERD